MKPEKANKVYQFAVMLISISITAYTLSRFSVLIQPLLCIPYDWKLEAAIVMGQLVFQFPFLIHKYRNRIFTYYYNMLLVALFGSALLWPLILINECSSWNIEWNVLYFFTVVGILFLDHMRRVRKLHLPSYLCYTWVVYRMIVLALLIY